MELWVERYIDVRRYIEPIIDDNNEIVELKNRYTMTKNGEFKHEVRQFQKPYDNQQAEQISLMV